MFIDFLVEVFGQNAEAEAVIWRDQSFTYGQLLDRTNHWRSYLQKNRITAGTVTAIQADFSPNAIALMLALIETGCIAVPLTSSVAANKAEFMAIAGVEALLEFDAHDEARLMRFRASLVARTSAAATEARASRADFVFLRLNGAEQGGRPRYRWDASQVQGPPTCATGDHFLLYDHIGGFNTMLYQLSNAGCIVTVQDRNPDTVLRAVERHKVELLPTSPTFINLVLLSEAYRRYDLSSFENCHLRNGADAGEHAATVPSGAATYRASTDLWIVGTRHLAFEIPLVRFTLGQARGRRFSDPRGG